MPIEKPELDAIVRGISRPIKQALDAQRDDLADLADQLAKLAARVAALEDALSPASLEDIAV